MLCGCRGLCIRPWVMSHQHREQRVEGNTRRAWLQWPACTWLGLRVQAHLHRTPTMCSTVIPHHKQPWHVQDVAHVLQPCCPSQILTYHPVPRSGSATAPTAPMYPDHRTANRQQPLTIHRSPYSNVHTQHTKPTEPPMLHLQATADAVLEHKTKAAGVVEDMLQQMVKAWQRVEKQMEEEKGAVKDISDRYLCARRHSQRPKTWFLFLWQACATETFL